MKNESENFEEIREENGEALNAGDAAQEAEIGARELAQEILPLLKENFVAKCRLTEEGISMRFPNGQHATVAVWFSK